MANETTDAAPLRRLHLARRVGEGVVLTIDGVEVGRVNLAGAAPGRAQIEFALPAHVRVMRTELVRAGGRPVEKFVVEVLERGRDWQLKGEFVGHESALVYRKALVAQGRVARVRAVRPVPDVEDLAAGGAS